MKVTNLVMNILTSFLPKENLERIIKFDDKEIEIYSSMISSRVVYNGEDIAYFTSIDDIEECKDKVIICGRRYREIFDDTLTVFYGELIKVKLEITRDGKIKEEYERLMY